MHGVYIGWSSELGFYIYDWVRILDLYIGLGSELENSRGTIQRLGSDFYEVTAMVPGG